MTAEVLATLCAWLSKPEDTWRVFRSATLLDEEWAWIVFRPSNPSQFVQCSSQAAAEKAAEAYNNGYAYPLKR